MNPPSEDELLVLSIMKEIRQECALENWKRVRVLCASLKDFTKVLSQLQVEKVIWYNNQVKSKEGTK